MSPRECAPTEELGRNDREGRLQNVSPQAGRGRLETWGLSQATCTQHPPLTGPLRLALWVAEMTVFESEFTIKPGTICLKWTGLGVFKSVCCII